MKLLAICSLFYPRVSAMTIRNSGLPICINCAHFIPHKMTDPYDHYRVSQYGKCAKFGETDLVSGEITYKYASTCRSFEDLCGKKGKHFVARSPSENKTTKS